jgi:hypothetical protein
VSERIGNKSSKEVRIVTTPVGGYELEMITGRTIIDPSGRRAELTLLTEQGDRLAVINFFGPEVELGVEHVDEEDVPLLNLPADQLSGVLTLLNSEKPVFFEFTDKGRLTTREDSTVE